MRWQWSTRHRWACCRNCDSSPDTHACQRQQQQQQ
jgi:hypothetical protein